jgi:prepilin-type N-terminal cleavage/methylation domain-containing protein
MRRREAFTLLEVLLSIALLSLVLLGLYRSLAIQRRSNLHLHNTLEKTLDEDKAVMSLYRDLLASNGRIGVIDGEFDRLCIFRTSHSLYGLGAPKVCWLVTRPQKELLRIEGSTFHLPLKLQEHVAIDHVMKEVTLFDIYRSADRILIVLATKTGHSYAFMVQGIRAPAKPPEPPETTSREGNRSRKAPDGNQTL